MRRPALLAAYAATSAVHVGAHLSGSARVAAATKPALMPLLLGWLLAGAPPRHRNRRVRLVAAALGLSWVGDVALMGVGERRFRAGLGAFLLAQGAYGAAFWPAARERRPDPALVAGYAAVWAAAMAVVRHRLPPDLVLPVAGYGLALVTTAGLATSVDPAAGAGAGLFVVSDALIATGLAGYDVPHRDALVMATYTVAQALIAIGATRAE